MTDTIIKNINDLRAEIDEIDQQLQKLLNRRASCALEVAQAKMREIKDSPVQFYRPEREAQVLHNVMQRNQGPLANETVARLFREIMSACLALEKPMRIGFLGPEG